MRISFLGLMLCVALPGALGCQPTNEAQQNKPSATTRAETTTPPDQQHPAISAPSVPNDAVSFTDDTLADEGETTEAGPPKPASPEALIAAMEDALEGVLRCPRAPGGLRVADPSECLRPLQRARDALTRTMKDELSSLLVRAASREEPTLILYALKHHEGDFGQGEAARQILEKRMNDRRMDIAVAAATARLHQLNREDTQGLSIARDYLTSERPDRLRVVCCAALGSPGFAGEREHIDLLLSVARDKTESALVRGCAAQQLGNLCTPGDINAMAALLKEPVIQSDTVVALIKGLGTAKAYSTVVRWLGKQVKRPELLQASTLSRLLPPKDKMADFPLNKLTKPLQTLITNARAPVATRLAAVETFSSIYAELEVRCLAKGGSKPCVTAADKLGDLLAKTERATLPNDLRVRSRLSRAKAALPAAAKPGEQVAD